jgi:hypothetical protein
MPATTAQLLALLAGLAGAEPAETAAGAPSSAAPAYEAVAVPIPAFALEGKSDGKADLTLSGGLLLRAAAEWDVTPRLSFEATTADGLGTLVSWNGAKGDATPVPWTLGASVLLANLPGRSRDRAVDDVKRQAYAACVDSCLPPVAETSKAFCEKRERELQLDVSLWANGVAADMKAKDFCEAQRKRADFVDEEQRAGRLDAKQALSRRVELLLECTKPCGRPWSAEERVYCAAPRFAQRPTEAQARRFADGEFCPQGNALFAEHRKAAAGRELVTRHPPLVLKAGGRVGRAEFSYLAADPAGTPGLLAVHEDARRAPWSAGGSFAWLLGSGGRTPTVEALVVRERSFTAASRSARWCVPAGSVADGTTPAPAEVCRELPLGGPTEARATRVAAYGGYVDQVADSWRVAAGLDVSLPDGGGSEVSLAVPLWISLTGTAGKYLGLVRFTPSVTRATGTDGARAWRLTLAIALLGQQTLFSPEFDRL